MKRLLLYFFVLAIVSCEPNRKLNTAKVNYDLNGLIDRQLELLDSVSPVLLKKATIEGINEETEFIPNDSIWKRELLIYRNADLNKPMLSGRFETEENTESGQTTITYRSKSPNSTKIDSLSIISDELSGEVLKIRADIRHGNFLYESAESLVLDFTKSNGINMLSKYRIDGYQNMILKKETAYTIEGKIKLRP